MCLQLFDKSGSYKLLASCNKVHSVKYKKVGVLLIWIVKSNVSSVVPSLFLSDEGLTLETSRLYILSVSAVHQPFYIISICILSLLCLRSTLRLLLGSILETNTRLQMLFHFFNNL